MVVLSWFKLDKAADSGLLSELAFSRSGGIGRRAGLKIR